MNSGNNNLSLPHPLQKIFQRFFFGKSMKGGLGARASCSQNPSWPAHQGLWSSSFGR
jgi:hypothetical protein